MADECGLTAVCGGRGRAVGFGQVDRFPAAGDRAGRALPRHRRDVPGGDLGGAARRRRPGRRRRRSRRSPRETELAIGTDPAAPHVRVDGDRRRRPRSAAPRSPRAVSAVAAVPAVRQLLVARQREIIAAAGADRRRGPRHRHGRRARRRPEGLPDRVRRRAGRAARSAEDAADVDRDRRPTWPAATSSTRPAPPTRCGRPPTRSCSTPPALGIDEVVARLRELLNGKVTSR